MKKFFLIILLYLFLEGLNAACPNTKSTIAVPAVINPTESKLVGISINFEPGEGKIYFLSSTLIGLLAQQSTKQALEVAFLEEKQNIKECNIYVDFLNTENSSLVDGPSASLAIALAAMAALENKTIPTNVVITGQIYPDGTVGPVGGIIDKVKAAEKKNDTKNIILITPKLEFYDKLILSSFNPNIKIYPVSNFSEAYAVAVLNKTNKEFKEDKTYLETEKIESLQSRQTTKKEEFFLDVAKNINTKLEQIIKKANTAENELLKEYITFFEQKIEQNKNLIQKGYYYTAANNAFLDLMNANLIMDIQKNRTDLDFEIDKIESCLQSLPVVEENENNFELAAGAWARYMLAKGKVDSLKDLKISSSEEKYLILRELYSAENWCEAAAQMLDSAKKIEGKKINTSSLKILLKIELNKLKDTIDKNSIYQNEDIKNYYSYANLLYENEKYSGALFHIAYAYSIMDTTSLNLNLNDSEIEKNVIELLKNRYNGMWSNLYQSQAIYLYKTQKEKKPPDYRTIYSVLALAQRQEEFLVKLINLEKEQKIDFIQIQNSKIEKKAPQNIELENFFVSLFLSLCIIILVAYLIEFSSQNKKLKSTKTYN